MSKSKREIGLVLSGVNSEKGKLLAIMKYILEWLVGDSAVGCFSTSKLYFNKNRQKDLF